jgi:GPH family glycoside/pentoside/hexuronide:cation symporter
MSSFYTVLLVVLFGLMLLKVSEKKEYLSKTSNPLVPGVRRALRNRPFRVFLAAAVVYSIPVMMPSLLMPYYVSYVLQPENPLSWLGIYLVLYLGSGVLCVPFWVKLSYRYGKLRVWLVCNVIGVLGGAALFFAGKGDLGYVALIEVLVGTQSGAFYFLGPAMVADVIDYDELRTGKRREAQYMAFMTLIPKFVAIPGASIPLAVMGSLGYQPNVVQNDDVQRAIRLMFALVPALFNLAALFIVLRYPLTEAVHSKIRLGLGQHVRGEVARDPMTNKPVAPPDHGSVNEQTGWFLDHFSPRELRRLASTGASGAVRSSVTLAFALALLALCVTTWVAVQSVHGLEASPGPMTVLAVVGAGLSLTWLVYEALRVLAAFRLVRSPPDRAVVAAHLDSAEW